MNATALNARQWEKILTACGVGYSEASSWSHTFSGVINEEAFSLGALAELPDFLGNILHESNMLTRLEENLYYTRPERLMQVWPKRFPTLALAQQYVRSPQRLADYVYGNRLGNINGDGWTYRGSGLIMVTGRHNFQLVEDATGLPVVSQPDLLRHPDTALEVAIAWWEAMVPDEAVGNRVRVRRAVNGGDIGLKDTIRLSNLAERAIDEVVS